VFREVLAERACKTSIVVGLINDPTKFKKQAAQKSSSNVMISLNRAIGVCTVAHIASV
jgi:hypothetical protein